MHPADHLRCHKDTILEGKKIVLGVTGSIAAASTVKLARELTRLGARVIPVMTSAATRIIHPDALWFACGSPAITELTGAVEHVSLCGEVPDHADMLLIAPSTANTIGKIAMGIDDTPVTTMATTAIGTGMPVVIVPAMHGTMYNNPMVMENLEKLRARGIVFIGPKLEEGKAKMASQDDIVAGVVRILGPGTLCGRRVHVITGPTAERVDDMRVLTNRSTGRMGLEIALEAYRLGADVTLWTGWGVEAPGFLNSKAFETHASLARFIEEDEGGWDVVMVPAAISDYSPHGAEGKIASGQKDLSLSLSPLEKLLPVIRSKTGFLVGFKAETGMSREELVERTRSRMGEGGADMMVGNLLEDVGNEETRMILVWSDGTRDFAGSKRDGAREIMAEVCRFVCGG